MHLKSLHFLKNGKQISRGLGEKTLFYLFTKRNETKECKQKMFLIIR
jgi:hypothetical protein